jgi:beta-glucosidase
VQTDWENALPVKQLETHNYSVRWTGTLTAPAAGHYVFSVELGDSFPYSPDESYRLMLDGKVLGEGSLRKKLDLSVMGNFHAIPGQSPTAPPVESFAVAPTIAVDFADTKPHEFVFEYSHAGDQSGGGVTLKWQAPAQVLLDEAVAQAKDADIVVAFVGLSPQLEGEEMPIKIEGFDGGDKTTIDLPAPQQKLLEALGATGKPLIVVLQSRGPELGQRTRGRDYRGVVSGRGRRRCDRAHAGRRKQSGGTAAGDVLRDTRWAAGVH